MNQELTNILKNFNGFNSDMLYDDLVVLQNTTGFNRLEFTKFLVVYSLLSNNDLSIDKITEYWSKVDRVDPNKLLKFNNSLDSVNPDWIGVMKPSSNSDNQDTNDQVKLLKIYLSIDNSTLHLFANQFLKACLDKDYTDFDFKINKKSNLNRRDNVVIYCSEENFGKYVDLIQEVIQNNPSLIFNQPHLLGIPYDEHIKCGVDFDNGKTSYTDRICEIMFKGLQNGKSPNEIVSTIECYKEQKTPAILAIAHMENSNSKH